MDTLSSAILGAVKEGAVTRLLRPFSNASSRQNEALLMLKPECFLGGEPEAVLQLIFRKLEAFGVELDATLVMEGPVLERLGIIDRHYRQAAAFSRQASSLVTPPERSQMAQLCGLDGPVLGGHEWLALHPQTSAEALDAAWFAQKPRKLRSGFYAVPFQSQDRPCLLVNGFYPAQAAHFTAKGRHVAVLALRSDLPWRVLRREMLGDTYPDKALEGSIRRLLLENRDSLGLPRVDITANFVHLSAGPFEGAAELVNFFQEQALALDTTKLCEYWVEQHQPIAPLAALLDHASWDLFGATEELDSRSAVAYALLREGLRSV